MVTKKCAVNRGFLPNRRTERNVYSVVRITKSTVAKNVMSPERGYITDQ